MRKNLTLACKFAKLYRMNYERLHLLKDKTFPNERDLYGATDIRLENCRFDGIEDGESALKEARNIVLDNCYMNLRYPLWHDLGVCLNEVKLTENCRAALWYTQDVTATGCDMLGIKALRECNRVNLDRCNIVSPEFGWRSHFVRLSNSRAESEYLFLMATDVNLENVVFKGKYSFQYAENVVIENSVLDTKDAFWHAKNVTVKNSIVKGEYLAWYSRNLTFVNCRIIGTQPLCYCEGLTLVDCQMEDTDLSFEYSDVQAEIKGNIVSVKNPRSGKIVADSIGELIYTADSKYPCNCCVSERDKGHL